MTPTRKEYQELLKTQTLWAVHYGTKYILLDTKPHKITRITKKFVYFNDDKFSGSMAIYLSEEEAWAKIVQKIKVELLNRDYLNNLHKRLTQLSDAKPHLFV